MKVVEIQDIDARYDRRPPITSMDDREIIEERMCLEYESNLLHRRLVDLKEEEYRRWVRLQGHAQDNSTTPLPFDGHPAREGEQ